MTVSRYLCLLRVSSLAPAAGHPRDRGADKNNRSESAGTIYNAHRKSIELWPFLFLSYARASIMPRIYANDEIVRE